MDMASSHSHHSEAGLIMSADLAPVMNQLSIGETLSVSPLARSTGSKSTAEHSNVCKVVTELA